MAFMDKCKEGAKLLGTVSVQMMIGGLVAAVVPGNVCALYKVAAYAGSCIAAMCLNDPVDHVVDKQFEALQGVMDQAKDYVNVLTKEN